MLLLCLTLVPEVLSDHAILPEVLWNFYQIKDKRKRLTLMENPHFYNKTPSTLLGAFWDGVETLDIDATEDFEHGFTISVLTDKQEPVHLIIDNKIVHSFGNLWHSNNGSMLLKGSGIFFVCSPVSDLLADTRGRLRGEGIVKAALRGKCSGFYVKRLPMSTGDSSLSRAFRTHNDRGLQPIDMDFKSYPFTTGWKSFIDSPSINSSRCSPGLCIYVITERVGSRRLVRRNIIALNCIF